MSCCLKGNAISRERSAPVSINISATYMLKGLWRFKSMTKSVEDIQFQTDPASHHGIWTDDGVVDTKIYHPHWIIVINHFKRMINAFGW